MINETQLTQAMTEIANLKGQKDDTLKDPMDLLPMLPLRYVSRVLGFGARKYGPHNWRNGLEYRRLLGATLRHIAAYSDGEDLDPETGESHIDHALCELLFLSQFIHEGRSSLDDRFKGLDSNGTVREVEKPTVKWVNERGLPMAGEPSGMEWLRPENICWQVQKPV